MALIELRGESAGYAGKTVLSDLDFSVEPGERIALVGESGAGKTTLLRMIYERCGNRAALVPQEFGLVQALTVFHNVYMGRLHLRSLWRNLHNLFRPRQQDILDVAVVLEKLRLSDNIFSGVGELSGGQQQRTAVGRALYHPGQVLVADEPVSSVDEHQAREILQTINSEKETVIIAMHDRSLAIEFADRLIGIKAGKIVLDVPSDGMKLTDLDELYQVSAE
jgi:phosphonate transport system ATP-binding protein